MLATLKDVLKVAEEKEIAIGAFNAPNLESLRWLLWQLQRRWIFQ